MTGQIKQKTLALTEALVKIDGIKNDQAEKIVKRGFLNYLARTFGKLKTAKQYSSVPRDTFIINSNIIRSK